MVESDERTYGVYELNRSIQQALYRTFRAEVWVGGEIWGLSQASGRGNLFFDLVEPDARDPARHARLSVVLLDSHRTRVQRDLDSDRVELEDGMAVRLRGRVDVYRPRGRLQLTMTGIDTAYTLGHFARNRDRVLRRLGTEGLLDANSSLGFPACPLRVGLVTSAQSAAAADFEHELRGSGFGFSVRALHTPVQGGDAERRIAAAVRVLGDERPDVIAVVRGGGARTELAVFDSETVARAIATCPVPVITGIGHEVDETIADRVSHNAHKTPTACARALVAAVDGYLGRLAGGFGRIGRRVDASLRSADTDVTRTGRALAVAVREATDRQERRLGDRWAGITGRARLDLAREDTILRAVQPQLERQARAILGQARMRVDAMQSAITMADPERLTQRGWAMVRTPDGRVVVEAASVETGDRITMRLKGGSVTAVVQEVVLDEEAR
ncbi:MAG: exodeoxyribonuclease VII large subunit [Acidimicrobiia bacterium]|nr:exodeoxyribonuclease VII large subunit [Acidimicrobiia bacterium]